MHSSENKNEPQGRLFIREEEMESTFLHILLEQGFPEEKASLCARIFTESSLDGVYTHGVNRFPRFVEYIRKGYINILKEPVLKRNSGLIEQWDGQLGPGPLNALQCTERAMEIARKDGMGCIGLSNTNHWMRGGSYGWKAAKAGFVFMGWTNTTANMPAWGAQDKKLGNNPLVLAVPYQDDAIVLDMAMSQFSFGTMEASSMKKQPLPFPGGYDKEGKLTKNASDILETERALPVGYWKGAGLSLLLDIMATLLSGGLSTAEISRKEAEYGVSQVFIAIDLSRLGNYPAIQQVIQAIIEDYKASVPQNPGSDIRYPGERALSTRAENKARGIPVNKNVWHQILSLKA